MGKTSSMRVRGTVWPNDHTQFGSHTAREATFCDRTNRLATKRIGSYKVAGSPSCQASLSTDSPERVTAGSGLSGSETKPAYAVGSHYLLGVAATGNPLACEISLMRGKALRPGGMLGFRKYAGFEKPRSTSHRRPESLAISRKDLPPTPPQTRPTHTSPPLVRPGNHHPSKSLSHPRTHGSLYRHAKKDPGHKTCVPYPVHTTGFGWRVRRC